MIVKLLKSMDVNLIVKIKNGILIKIVYNMMNVYNNLMNMLKKIL